MRRAVLAGLLAVALTSCTDSPPPVDDGVMLRGRVTVTAFRSELQGALTNAMATSPLAAISVCSAEAPQIAAGVARGNGVEIGRTSHRLRNPENSPEGWTHRWLRHYLEHPDDREAHAEYLDRETIGYVEPIIMKPLCLTCHGEAIAPEVAARIDELYPKDNARGFKDGELRGLFWVKMPVEKDGG